jgi:DNA-binding transcriptional ArsR family regulator
LEPAVRDDLRQVTDPKALGVLAHPVRLDLFNHLMAYGERTASQCAAAVGASPSACSYHLRQLAKYGIVESVPADDGRERPWRATAPGFSFRAEPEDPAGMALRNNVAALQLDRDTAAARAALLRVEQLPREWQDAVNLSRYALTLTAAELTDLLERLDELVAPYRGSVRPEPPPDAKRVHLHWHAFVVEEQ